MYDTFSPLCGAFPSHESLNHIDDLRYFILYLTLHHCTALHCIARTRHRRRCVCLCVPVQGYPWLPLHASVAQRGALRYAAPRRVALRPVWPALPWPAGNQYLPLLPPLLPSLPGATTPSTSEWNGSKRIAQLPHVSYVLVHIKPGKHASLSDPNKHIHPFYVELSNKRARTHTHTNVRGS